MKEFGGKKLTLSKKAEKLAREQKIDFKELREFFARMKEGWTSEAVDRYRELADGALQPILKFLLFAKGKEPTEFLKELIKEREKETVLDLGGRPVRVRFHLDNVGSVPVVHQITELSEPISGTLKVFAVTFPEIENPNNTHLNISYIGMTKDGTHRYTSYVLSGEPIPSSIQILHSRLRGRKRLSSIEKKVLDTLNAIISGSANPQKKIRALDNSIEALDIRMTEENARAEEERKRKELTEFTNKFNEKLSALQKEFGFPLTVSPKDFFGREGWEEELRAIAQKEKGLREEAENKKTEFLKLVKEEIDSITKSQGINLSGLHSDLAKTLEGNKRWREVLNKTVQDTINGISSELSDKMEIPSGKLPQVLSIWEEGLEGSHKQLSRDLPDIDKVLHALAMSPMDVKALMNKVEQTRKKDKRFFPQRFLDPLYRAKMISEVPRNPDEKISLTDEGRNEVNYRLISSQPEIFKAGPKFRKELLKRL